MAVGTYPTAVNVNTGALTYPAMTAGAVTADSLTSADDVTATDDVVAGDDVTIGDDVTLASGSVLTWAGDTTLTRASAGVIGVQGLSASTTLAVTGASTLTGAVTTGAGEYIGPPAHWTSQDHGFISWSADPAAYCSGQQITINGTLYLAGLRIRRAATITNVHWIPSTAGASPTSSQNFAALYSSAGTLLSSVGIDAKVTNANALQTATLAVAQPVAAGALVWVGLLFNAGTAPTLHKGPGALSGPIVNCNLAAVGYRHAANGTSQTALPSPITPSSNVVSIAFWMAVS